MITGLLTHKPHWVLWEGYRKKHRAPEQTAVKSWLEWFPMIRFAGKTCFWRKKWLGQRGPDMCDFVAVKSGKAPGFHIIECAQKRKTRATLTRAGTPPDTVVARLNTVRSTKRFLGKAYGTGHRILLNCSGSFWWQFCSFIQIMVQPCISLTLVVPAFS